MELTIENIIKIIIGVLVLVVVVTALYLFFKNQVFDLFKNIGINSTTSSKFILGFLM